MGKSLVLSYSVTRRLLAVALGDIYHRYRSPVLLVSVLPMFPISSLHNHHLCITIISVLSSPSPPHNHHPYTTITKIPSSPRHNNHLYIAITTITTMPLAFQLPPSQHAPQTRPLPNATIITTSPTTRTTTLTPSQFSPSLSSSPALLSPSILPIGLLFLSFLHLFNG